MTPTRTVAYRSTPLLPGQAAAPAGPLDLTSIYVAHHAIRRDLAAFAAAVAHTPTEERRTWAALARRWALFARELRHHHHTEEAGLWPLLRARADAQGDRQPLAALAALADEHQEIEALLESSAAGLTRLTREVSTTDDDVRAALVVRMNATKESVARHLRHEESDALAMVQKLVSPQEWSQLEQEPVPRGSLPVGATLTRVPWALHGLPVTVQQALLSRRRPAHRLAWHLAHSAFERQERRTFRHAADESWAFRS